MQNLENKDILWKLYIHVFLLTDFWSIFSLLIFNKHSYTIIKKNSLENDDVKLNKYSKK